MKAQKSNFFLSVVLVLSILVYLPLQDLNAHAFISVTSLGDPESITLDYSEIEDKKSLKLKSTMDLMYFKGKMLMDRILLSWMSAAENESNGFTIQMKIDDQPWEKVGWVDAYSESWHAPEYLFEIEDLMTGQYFFRLQQSDENGNETFSEIISMNYTGQPNSLLAYPNSTNNFIYVNGPSEESIKTVALFDLDGILVYESPEPGNSISIDQIPAGKYLLKCIYEEIIAETKVVIQ
jgi:hypothetical protein